MNLVRIEGLSKTYTLGKQQVEALRDIHLAVAEGEFLAIAGPSGSGKSTLLNMIGCIDTPTAGLISIGNQAVEGRTPDELADLRLRLIGFIFQNFNLLPVLSAAENVEYPLLQMKELARSERKRRVAQYLELVGLDKFARHRPAELSGGQRQRVAIARALATRPKLILADEPTANLDHATGSAILQLMKEINRTQKATFVFSTHDPSVMDLADRVVEVNDGVLTQRGIFKTWDVREDLEETQRDLQDAREDLLFLEAEVEEVLNRVLKEVAPREADQLEETVRRRRKKVPRTDADTSEALMDKTWR